LTRPKPRAAEQISDNATGWPDAAWPSRFDIRANDFQPFRARLPDSPQSACLNALAAKEISLPDEVNVGSCN
jgi:hypothetical protein